MAQWQELKNDSTTFLWRLYENGIDFQNKLQLREKLPRFVDFFEGKQWPSPTEGTKNMPRPVVNIIKMICRNKKSAILSTPVKILYKSYTPLIDTDSFNSFAECMQKELGQENLDRMAIDDGIKKGSYFYHYYWDPYATGLDGREDGGVRCELIDPLNIFFENPAECDEQKQEWILISSRKSISAIKALADPELDLSALKPEDNEELYSINEQENEGKATLLTRYFKKNGEVFCERATKSIIITKPFSLTPICLSNNGEMSLESDTRARLFPVVCGYYEKKQGSIYGLSEIEGLIPNQKAINFNIAMSLLNIQECAWGKYIALPNALKGQSITNAPGQVLVDYTGTGNGIKKMSEQSLSSLPMDITTSLAELTRSVSGASEVMTGESYNSNMSGAAIAYLQAQAQMPIEDLKLTFWNVKRKQGLVLAQFFKLYYYERKYLKKIADKNGEEREVFDLFSSKNYKNAIFDVVIEAVGGSRASVSTDISLLDSALSAGHISLETYIKAYPESAITNKQEILKQIALEKNSEINRLKAEISALKNSKNAPISVDNSTKNEDKGA